MANIILAPRPETGHINATIGLARRLSRRGHRVSYLTLPDYVDYVAAQGFTSLPMLARAFPRGWVAAERARSFGEGRWRSWLRTRVEALRMFTAICDEPFEEHAAALSADALLVDRELPALALRAIAIGLPTATVATTMPARRLSGVSPYTCGWTPDDDTRSRLRADLAWRRLILARKVRAQLGRTVGAESWRILYARAAARFGYRGRIHHDAIGAPEIDLPQLVLCPRAFDYPWTPDVEGMTHGAAFIDSVRRELAARPSSLDEDRRLIVCSFGSQGHRLGGHVQLMVALVQAMASRPHLRLCLALGDQLSSRALPPLPGNVEAQPRIPQLQLLRRAALFITHGGLNSIKESIHCGVPMLVAPIGFDQPGNAARVAFHGIGIRISANAGATIGRVVDGALEDETMRVATHAMRRRFAEADAAGDGLELVERLLPIRAMGAAS